MNINTILTPVISEKSLARVEALNEYTFRAPRSTTKNQVKEIVQKAFNVKVLAVNTKLVKGKSKRAGKLRRIVRSADAKQVTVKLDKKDKIDLFEIKEGGQKK